MKRKMIITLGLSLALSTTGVAFAATSDTVSGASEAPAQSAPAKPAPAKPAATATPKAKAAVSAPVVAANGDTTYKVVSGDSLAKIATKCGTTYQELAKLNNISDPSTLQVGQVLIIKKAAVAAPAATPKPAATPAPKAAAPAATPKPAAAKPAATTVPAATPAPAAEETPAATDEAAMDAAATAEATTASGAAVEVTASGAAVDVVTTASVNSDPDVLIKGLSKDGNWINAITEDVTVSGDLNVDGTFNDKGDKANAVYRKLALYSQDDKHNVTAEFTLTVAGAMNVTSPNFRIQNGTLKGNVTVKADGFELAGSTLDGNLNFATQAQKDSAKLDKGKVTGTITVGLPVGEAVDTETSASINADPAILAKGLSSRGNWINAITKNETIRGDLNVDGTFNDKGDPTKAVYRKLALYTQDANHTVIDQFTLKLNKMNVTSPNFRIQNGTIVGDIYVNAYGFELFGATVQGNVYFSSQAKMDSAKLKTGKVTGRVGIAVNGNVTAATSDY